MPHLSSSFGGPGAFRATAIRSSHRFNAVLLSFSIISMLTWFIGALNLHDVRIVGWMIVIFNINTLAIRYIHPV
jgi:hypothetical protein